MTVLQMDSTSASVLCIEEPENGIHPFAIPGLVDLLRDYTVDPEEAVDHYDNPLRQVIANSHSPKLASRLAMNEVLFVDSIETAQGAEARVRSIDHDKNWRDDDDPVTVARFEEVVGTAPTGQAVLGFEANE